MPFIPQEEYVCVGHYRKTRNGEPLRCRYEQIDRRLSRYSMIINNLEETAHDVIIRTNQKLPFVDDAKAKAPFGYFSTQDGFFYSIFDYTVDNGKNKEVFRTWKNNPQAVYFLTLRHIDNPMDVK